MSKFKVGDRVKVIGTRSRASAELFGREGTIIEIHGVQDFGGFVFLDIEKESPFGFCGLWFTDIEHSQSHLNEQKIRKLLGVERE